VSAALVSIIGPPAVGKTTLAEHLADELPARLLREDYEGNPFLAESYLGRAEARLPAQLYYLMSRTSQLSRLGWPAEGLAVSDYGFCQDRVFARQRLDAAELAVYEQVAARMASLVQPPDVLICLDASEATLLARIARRGRAFETAMTGDFLAAMRRAYGAEARAASCAVIEVDCDRVDVRDAAWRRGLAERLAPRIRAE
jgi:deoxyadenosine/deoxycytidine kinase